MSTQSRSAPLLSVRSNVQSSPKWSMRGKAANTNKSNTPGPGSYAPDDSSGYSHKYRRPPACQFGAASRDGIRPQSAPGPGQYNPSNPEKQGRGGYGFGTSDRVGIRNRHEMPGPASYQIPSKMGSEGPKYSNSGKRSGLNQYCTPGPGSYEPNESMDSTVKTSANWGFGTSPRDGRPTPSSPGPGSYSKKSHMAAGPAFTMKGRNEASRIDIVPGPGEYSADATCFG